MQPAGFRPGLRTFATALLALAWWVLLIRVIHACFLRPPPRSLERTLEALLDPPGPSLALVLALAAGSGLRIALGQRALLDAVSLTTALAWLALLLG